MWASRRDFMMCSCVCRNRSSSHIIFSNMFCSKDCTLTWMMLNGSKYNVINWTELLQL